MEMFVAYIVNVIRGFIYNFMNKKVEAQIVKEEEEIEVLKDGHDDRVSGFKLKLQQYRKSDGSLQRTVDRVQSVTKPVGSNSSETGRTHNDPETKD